MTDRHADADPEETVTLTGVGTMTLRRAVRRALVDHLRAKGYLPAAGGEAI